MGTRVVGDIFYQRLTAKLMAEIVPHLGPKIKDENAAFGRALTALYFAAEGGMPIEQSSQYIVDGTGDFGIDGLWHDTRTNRILIASTKFRENQSKGFEQGDILKFLHGAQKIIEQSVDEMNPEMKSVYSKIAPAIKDVNTRIIFVFLTTGRVELAPNCHSIVKGFCDKKNAGLDDTFGFEYVKFEKLYGLGKLYSPNIKTNVNISISECGKLDSPYVSFFGYVNGNDVASWVRHYGTALFSQNVRFAIPGSEVNDGMSKTISDFPQHFWYFNNGITAIATDIKRAPSGGGQTHV